MIANNNTSSPLSSNNNNNNNTFKRRKVTVKDTTTETITQDVLAVPIVVDECNANDYTTKIASSQKRKLDDVAVSNRVSPTSVVQEEEEEEDCDVQRRYDNVEDAVMVATYDANDPSEDRFDYMLNLDLVPRRMRNSNDNNCRSDRGAVDVVGYTLSLFGVYDGHGGGDCAQFAQDHLLRTCAAHIAVALDCEVDNFDLGDEALEDARDARHSSVNKALCTAFVNVDERWMSDIDPDVVQSSCYKGGPWNSGSCAVVAALLVPELMDEDGESRRTSEELTSKLYTAHLGDCRAVLFSDNHIHSTDSNLFLPVVREKIGPYAHLNCCEQLTEDHAASNKSEQTLVVNRCGDSSRAIITGASGVARVAGSLAVTRALGDAYLKRPDMSFGSYKEHCPFIICVPEVSCKVIGVPFSDAVPSQLLCMGTDGIFEKIESNQSIINEIQSSTNQDRSLMNNNVVVPDQNLSNIVIDHVIEIVCSIRDLTKRSFTALKPGRARRSKHDDMTFMTIDLSAFL